MAQYYTDFSEYTTGQHPAGWTQRRDEATSWSVEADAGATGGKVLRFPGKAANTQSILTWDAIDSDSGRADVEILIRYRYGGTSASLYAWARDASTSSAATGYRCGDSYTGTTIGIIGKYVSGSYTNIYTAGAGAINATNTWAYIRAQISGNSLRVRVWKAGDPEPDTWRGTGTDNSLSTGRVGIMIFNTASVDIDWIGIGTGGDPAPDSPVDPGGDDLAATGLDILSAVGAPSLSQRHGLVALGIDAGCDVGLPSLSQAHGLAALGIDIDGDLGLPGVGQGHALSATGLSVTSDLGVPWIGQHHAFSAWGLDVAADLGSPAVAQEHGLAAVGLDLPSLLGLPALSTEGTDALQARGLSIQGEVGQPAVGQEHQLSALGIASDILVGRPAIGQVGSLAAIGLDVRPDVGLPTLAEDAYALTAVGLDVATDAGVPVMGQKYHLQAMGVDVTVYVGLTGLDIGLPPRVIVAHQYSRTLTAIRSDRTLTAIRGDRTTIARL